MQINIKTSIISAIFVCLFFVVSCGDSSKEEPKNDTDSETTDDNEISDEDGAGDDGETADDTEAESGRATVSSIKFTIPEEASTVAGDSGHFAFPDVVKLANGKLMAVYRNGSTHVDKSGLIIVCAE